MDKVATPQEVHEGMMWQAANMGWPCPVDGRRPDQHTDTEWQECLNLARAAVPDGPRSAKEPAGTEEPRCCHIPCDKMADFEIHDGNGPDDVTHGCEGHVGVLLSDGENRVYPLPRLVIDAQG